jgi:hypothetical protein
MSKVNTILDHIEPEFEKALIADVKYGKKLIQVLRDLNKKWTDLLSPNTKDSVSTCTPEYYESVRIAVTKGWPTADRTLWETPSKELDPVEKNRKRELGMAIGSKIKDLRKQLKKDQLPKKERAEARSPLQRFWDHIHDAGYILTQHEIFDDANVFKKIEKAIQDVYDADEMTHRKAVAVDQGKEYVK